MQRALCIFVIQCAFHSFAEFTEKDCSRLYEKAICQNPTINLHVAKAMTMGPPRVGKTTLRHLLLELQSPDVIASTPVMTAAETVTIVSSEEQVAEMEDDAIDQAGKKSVQAAMIHLGSFKSWLIVNEASGVLSLLRFLQKHVEQAATRRKATQEPVKAMDATPLAQLQSADADTQNANAVQPPSVTFPDIEPVSQEEVVVPPSDVATTASKICHSLPSPDITNVELPDSKPVQCLHRKAAKESAEAVDATPSPQLQSADADTQNADAVQPQLEPSVEISDIKHVPQEKVVTPPSDVATTARVIYDLLQSPDITNVELPDSKLLQFLDCGGQLAYHDILPVFTTIPAVYLHVFNLNEDLNSHPVDQICFSEDDGEVCGSAKSPLTVAQMMVRSIMTVNSLIDVERQLPKDVLQSEPPEPRVVLVGTHLDKLEERCKGAIKQELESVKTVLNIALDSTSLCLKEMLVRNQHPALPPMFFPTGKISSEQVEDKESSQITRHSVMELKQKIEKLVSAVRVKVPVKWYLHQMLDISRSKEERKPVHEYRDLYQSCLREQAVSDLGEFHAMVTYFHALGLLIHLCGEDVPHGEESDCLVFTDPSYLFENITKLYQVQFMEEDRCEGSLQALRCQGRLTKEALQALNVDTAYLSDDQFMDLLIQLFIGADITERVGGADGKVLFVPSVIPVDTASQPRMIPNPSCPYLIITFESKLFIPCGVFTGAIARLQSNPSWNLLYKCISRVHARFSIGARDIVDVIDNSTHIKVAVSARDQHNKEQYRDTIIRAMAESYCFLFHGKKSLHCEICQEKSFLVLGLLCHCPSCVDKEATNISKLCTEDSIPQTVRCQESGDAKDLSVDQASLFWNIKHYVSISSGQ